MLRRAEASVIKILMNAVVLVVDDEKGVRKDLDHWLTKMGHSVHTACDFAEAKRIIDSCVVDIAIVDLKVDFRSDVGGAEILRYLKSKHPRSKAVILSAHSLSEPQVQSAVRGLYDEYVSKGGQENYISQVIAKIRAMPLEKHKRQCFVIMPFSTTKSCTAEEWTDIYETMIKPAVEMSQCGYECRRSDIVEGNIIEDIIDNLFSADVVIADLTDKNPNVFYELGVRHALRQGTILITQELSDIPFDLRPYMIHAYRWKTSMGKEEFRTKLQKVISELTINPKRGTSPVLARLKKVDKP